MNDKSCPSRDFIGYADQQPTVVWPDEARVSYWCLLKAFNYRGLKATIP